MITKCQFCDYQREKPLNKAILKLMQDSPAEDFGVWMERLVRDYGYAERQSVKIHMGRMHKGLAYKYIFPDCIYDEEEQRLVHEYTQREDVSIPHVTLSRRRKG